MNNNTSKLATLACGATLLLAGTASAQTTLKVSHYLPSVHGIHTDFIVPWTEQVTACTNGEVQFEIYPGGTQLGNVAKQQEQVMAGVVDIAHGLQGIPRGRFPRTSLIELPFLTRDAGAASETLWQMYPDYLAPEYRGLKVLALHAHNGGLIHTADKKVQTMEDMQGLRLRTPSPAVSQMLTALGATPQGLPPGEVYENIQKHVIDGTVFPWDPVKSFGLNEVLDYHLDAGAYTVPFFFVMNQRKYDSLPENVQACIDEASGDSLVAKFGDWWDKWDAAGREEAEASGDVITHLSDAERQRWRETLQPVTEAYIEETANQGVDNAREIYERMRELLAEKQQQQ
ncbi:TRAP transporter substrate-binding protein [Halomonas sp. HP20-15]|uniref:TRAP transporter substrate-binding protein n=1 Tax=Halomonas sp. HP20-15 TaxID=3085901 RepID=UPI0029827A1D|nr:TRAP transporter substrate-binding protein [Halomonas sp. HP20-15]MDW5376177.1 TRAP transporter substrate-binding protein [Halomonas sp. HP20-15]